MYCLQTLAKLNGTIEDNKQQLAVFHQTKPQGSLVFGEQKAPPAQPKQ